tara:strand:+ start:852 stop:1052 length:201 start_codon:yes stop_codon:yes gene_type:complete
MLGIYLIDWKFWGRVTLPLPAPVRRIIGLHCDFVSVYAYILYLFFQGRKSGQGIYKTIFVFEKLDI